MGAAVAGGAYRDLVESMVKARPWDQDRAASSVPRACSTSTPSVHDRDRYYCRSGSFIEKRKSLARRGGRIGRDAILERAKRRPALLRSGGPNSTARSRFWSSRSSAAAGAFGGRPPLLTSARASARPRRNSASRASGAAISVTGTRGFAPETRRRRCSRAGHIACAGAGSCTAVFFRES